MNTLRNVKIYVKWSVYKIEGLKIEYLVGEFLDKIDLENHIHIKEVNKYLQNKGQ